MYKPNEAKLFGLALKQLLAEKNLSQRQFAKNAGLDPSDVSKLVNGKVAEPRQENRCKIAKGLGMTEQELLEYIAQYRNSEIEKTISAPPGLAESEEAIAKPPQESVENRAGSGENLISLATSILEQIGFNQKFKMNQTSQYTGYRLKNSGERAKRYLLVLAQCKEGLCISISRNILNLYVLELKFYDDVWVSNEYGYDEAQCQEFNRLYWVIPSKEDIFFEISQDYKGIFTGESTGSFYLDPKGIDTDDVIHKDLKGFKLKRSKDPGFDWHFDHGDLLARLDQSDCCISMNNIDRLFPHTRKVYINSREILEEFVHYFGEILMENY